LHRGSRGIHWKGEGGWKKERKRKNRKKSRAQREDIISDGRATAPPALMLLSTYLYNYLYSKMQ
jgi:hypothetical protein